VTPIRFPFLLAALLAGCAIDDSARISFERFSRIYRPGETMAVGPTLAVFVFGSPFGEPIEQFSAEVIDAMQGWPFSGWPVRFGQPGEVPVATYRVAMIFDRSAFGPRVCESPLTRADRAAAIPPVPPAEPSPPAAVTAPLPARLPLTAVLCRGDTYLAWADGTVAAGSGSTSPEFRRGVGRFTRALFPSRNPGFSPGGNFNFGF
jgi:hypothetical protein